MLFINISSDKVQIADAKKDRFLDRNGIETTIGKSLIDRYEKSPYEQILLLNGPGGFTNLRVGTLALNLLNKLLDHKSSTDAINRVSPGAMPLQIFSITKFDLYSYLFEA